MDRWEKKNEIILKMEELEKDLDKYLTLWRKTGGGTTGHAIGSARNKIKSLKNFFKNYC